MERAPDGLDAILTHGKLLEAANDSVIDGSGPVRGWDPFEIWRKRVRDAREQPPMDGDEIPS